MAAAEAAGFEVIVTTDQEIPFQQNLSALRIAIVILCAETNRLATLIELIPDVRRALGDLQPGTQLLKKVSVYGVFGAAA